MRKHGQGIPPTQIPEVEAWEMAGIVWNAPEDKVLSISQVKDYPWGDDFGEIMGLVPCANCDELVAKAFLRVVDEAHMCIPCSEYER